MIFVIGDIHGEISKLRLLLKYIKRIDKGASFIFIGDYIDKGEDARATLSFLSDFSKDNDCNLLLGNHEYLWLKLKEKDTITIEYLLKYGGKRTIESFGMDNIINTKNKMLDEYYDLFNQLVPFWQNDDYVVTHSGIDPFYIDKRIEVIPVDKLLFNRYSFIEMETLAKGNRKIIFGHTGFFSPYVDDYKIGIDTAACFLENQPITAFCIEGDYFVNSFGSEYSIESIKVNCCPVIPRTKPFRENYAN